MNTEKTLERLRHERDLVGSNTILHKLKNVKKSFFQLSWPIHCTEIKAGEKWIQLIQGTIHFVYEKEEEPKVTFGDIFTEGKINDDWKKLGAVTWDLNDSDDETIERSVCSVIAGLFGTEKESDLEITTKDLG